MNLPGIEIVILPCQLGCCHLIELVTCPGKLQCQYRNKIITSEIYEQIEFE